MGFGEAKQQKQVLLVQFGAVANDISSQKSASNNIVESIIPQLTNTVTPIEKPVKKLASQTTEFMDDLFGFDEQSESNEMTKTAAIENIPDQQDQNNQSMPKNIDTSKKYCTEMTLIRCK